MNPRLLAGQLARSLTSPSAAWNMCYCATGVVGVLLVQWLDYQGAVKSAASGLAVLPMFLGLLVLGTPAFFRNEDKPGTTTTTFSGGGGGQGGSGNCQPARRWHKLFPALALLNIGGEATSQLCIATSGSGTYIVLYSSMTVFTVAFRRAFLKKGATAPMLAGILVIVAGLAMTIGGVSASPHGGSNSRMGVGVIAGLASALLYAAYYVMGESVLCARPESPDQPLVSPWAMGAYEGYFFTILYVPYFAFLLFTGRLSTMVTQPMAEAHADGNVVAVCYLVLVLVNGMHVIALLKLLRHTDAIVAGINKAVQAVSVFVFSSLMYCHRDAKQCLTPLKGGSIAVVILGVAIYTWASWHKGKQAILMKMKNDSFAYQPDGSRGPGYTGESNDLGAKLLVQPAISVESDPGPAGGRRRSKDGDEEQVLIP